MSTKCNFHLLALKKMIKRYLLIKEKETTCYGHSELFEKRKRMIKEEVWNQQ